MMIIIRTVILCTLCILVMRRAYSVEVLFTNMLIEQEYDSAESEHPSLSGSESSAGDSLELNRIGLSSTDRKIREKCSQMLLEKEDAAGTEMILSRYYEKFDMLDASARYGNRPLLTHSKESLIPYLYDSVYHGTYYHDFRLENNFMLLGIIERSERFPEPTRQWATKTRKYLAIQDYLYSVSIFSKTKEWLYHNRIEILDGNYEMATWLPSEELKENYRDANGVLVADPSIPSIVTRPVLTKLVKTLPIPEENSPSKARLIDLSQFFPERERERKREIPGPAAFTPVVSPQRFAWGGWLACLIVVIATLLWRWVSKEKSD